MFNVVKRLSTEVILGCDFCDKHIESIRHLHILVELNDGTTIPIKRQAFERKKTSVPLRIHCGSDAKVVTSEYITLLPESTHVLTKHWSLWNNLLLVSMSIKTYRTVLSLTQLWQASMLGQNMSLSSNSRTIIPDNNR